MSVGTHCRFSISHTLFTTPTTTNKHQGADSKYHLTRNMFAIGCLNAGCTGMYVSAVTMFELLWNPSWIPSHQLSTIPSWPICWKTVVCLSFSFLLVEDLFEFTDPLFGLLWKLRLGWFGYSWMFLFTTVVAIGVFVFLCCWCTTNFDGYCIATLFVLIGWRILCGGVNGRVTTRRKGRRRTILITITRPSILN